VTAVLGALLLAAGANTIRAHYHGPRWQVYACKPLTILLAMAVAVSAPDGPPGAYRALILAGLAWSLVGDVLLMLPADRFVAGLACFLVAHLWYIAAFGVAAPRPAPAILLVSAGAIGLALFLPLWPYLGRLRAPVAAYALALVGMLWQATGWAATGGGSRARLAAAGALVFVASDAVLAYNRFRRPLRGAQAAILSTYFVAQGLIAASVGR
jgi:uncharacterized membrane protein YhhN